jgi:hypothetical protein
VPVPAGEAARRRRCNPGTTSGCLTRQALPSCTSRPTPATYGADLAGGPAPAWCLAAAGLLAKIGVTVGKRPQDIAFCVHIIRATACCGGRRTGPTASATTRLVTGRWASAFYAGMPLLTREGPPGAVRRVNALVTCSLESHTCRTEQHDCLHHDPRIEHEPCCRSLNGF